MDKEDVLLSKYKILINEMDKAKTCVSPDLVEYLELHENLVKEQMAKLEAGTLPASGGSTFRIARALSEFNTFCLMESLYNAACDVDEYYRVECNRWD